MAATPPRVEDVLDFLTSHNFARAASALRDDVIARHEFGGAPVLPPVRIPHGGFEQVGESSSSSDGEFVSMVSSPSELLNPFWSPTQPKSEDSSDMHSEFGTARDYNESNIFGDSFWYGDQYGGYLKDPLSVPTTISGSFHSEDKFVMSIEAEEKFRKEESRNLDSTDKPDVYSCLFPLCDCCTTGKVAERDKLLSSNASIYGRYQILPDETERLDECAEDEIQLKKVDKCIEAALGKGDSFHDLNRTGGKFLELLSVDKQSQMIDSYAVNGANYDLTSGPEANGSSNHCIRTSSVSFKDNAVLEKSKYNMQSVAGKAPSKDGSISNELEKCEMVDNELADAGAVGVEGEVHSITDETQVYSSNEDEYEVFELRIVHRKNRTGFEENKDFPIILNSVVAGRYYITEYLGSAAFSKVVQAYDLQTGIDVCLKIIKNDKDFFDQSLDEIKLLKFVNKYDPSDECHILRLYDYFYHQEHLFIVCELLRANLYEFQKYNQDSGGEVYFTLPRIQVITRQCLEALEYLHHLRIIHCDLKPENILMKSYSKCEIKIIDLGSSCFQTDNLCLYVQSRSYRAPEVIIGFSYDEKIDIWSLGCILAELYTGDVLFSNDSVVMMLARMIGILGPIDMEMLEMGQETHKYFTDGYDLYHKNEETDQIEYLIPEKSSLADHLQASDTEFVSFLSYLLQINPKMRPTASQALQHPWLSFLYQ